MRMDKWFSHGLSWKEIGELMKQYGKIKEARYSVLEGERLVCFELAMEDGLVGGCNLDPKDAEQLFARTRVSNISDLNGKVVEVYLTPRQIGHYSIVRGVSVNENLV